MIIYNSGRYESGSEVGLRWIFREDGVKIMQQTTPGKETRDLLVIVPEYGNKKTTPKYLVGDIDRDDMMIGVRSAMLKSVLRDEHGCLLIPEFEVGSGGCSKKKSILREVNQKVYKSHFFRTARKKCTFPPEEGTGKHECIILEEVHFFVYLLTLRKSAFLPGKCIQIIFFWNSL